MHRVGELNFVFRLICVPIVYSHREHWLKAIRTYNSFQLKEMLCEGNVSTSWTYKSTKKLKHSPLVNTSQNMESSHLPLVVKNKVVKGNSVDDWEVTCMDVAISTDDSTFVESRICIIVDSINQRIQLTEISYFGGKLSYLFSH